MALTQTILISVISRKLSRLILILYGRELEACIKIFGKYNKYLDFNMI